MGDYNQQIKCHRNLPIIVLNRQIDVAFLKHPGACAAVVMTDEIERHITRHYYKLRKILHLNPAQSILGPAALSGICRYNGMSL